MTILSAPGKTFLVGEYLALEGGPSLVLATAPNFRLSVSLAAPRASSVGIARGSRLPFAPQSPAGKLMARHQDALANARIEFDDPHRGAGGLGASSAQFVLLWSYLNKISSFAPETFDWARLLEVYRACAFDGVGRAPSGADVVSQMCGGVTWFDGANARARRLEWKFPNLAFTLIRTGKKLATHEHLRQAQAAPREPLRDAVTKATTAFETGDENALIEAVRSVRQTLESSGLVAETTRRLLADLDRSDIRVLAAKGCGAMGADVVLVLHDRNQRSSVEAWAKAKDLWLCGSDLVLATGLTVNRDN